MGNKWSESYSTRDFAKGEAHKLTFLDSTTGQRRYFPSIDPNVCIGLAHVPSNAKHLRFDAKTRAEIEVSMLPAPDKLELPLNLDTAIQQGFANIRSQLHDALAQHTDVNLILVHIARHWNMLLPELIQQELKGKKYTTDGIGDYGRNRYRVYTVPFTRSPNEEMPTKAVQRNNQHWLDSIVERFERTWNNLLDIIVPVE